jgi:hypothetical protein
VSKTRAIRFSEQEEKQIEEFLENNPFFDFSTLAKMAILDFVKNPRITLHPVKASKHLSRSESPNGQPHHS